MKLPRNDARLRVAPRESIPIFGRLPIADYPGPLLYFANPLLQARPT
jgi:hypothetical protein